MRQRQGAGSALPNRTKLPALCERMVIPMKYQDLLAGLERFGSTKRDICVNCIGVEPERIHKAVMIAPWWEPTVFSNLGTNGFLSASEFDPIKVWDIRADQTEITYIKTGIGAPALMDVLLALGVTPCERAVFIGSVGALDSAIGIGDIVVPEFSICGDGASRYISSPDLLSGDAFGETQYPDRSMFTHLVKAAERVCKKNAVKWHIGKTFSTDTIFAQFAHIDEILRMGCNVIEMETAAAFRAAAVAGIPIAALFSVSDNPVVHKSLISGRTEEEMRYRKYVRRELFPQIVLDVLRNHNEMQP